MSTRPGALTTGLRQQLKHRRQQLGLSQAELAARLGVTQQMAAKLEGASTDLSVGTIERWAEALDAELILSIKVSKQQKGERR